MKKKTDSTKAAHTQRRRLKRDRALAALKAVSVEPLSNWRIHEKIAESLAISILSGRQSPGSNLPAEVEASAQLGVSRTVYREAVRILAAKGLIEGRPKLGTRVTEKHRWNWLDPDVLRWIFESQPDPEYVEELFELRLIVEPQAAALAAKRRSIEELARMGHALEEMARHGLNTPAGQAADQQFHDAILKSTRNRGLATLTTTIGAAIQWTTVFKYQGTPRDRNPIVEHRNLYAAIANADSDAAREAARELIEIALEDTRFVMKGAKKNSGKAKAG